MPLKVYYLDDETALLDIFKDAFSSPDCVVETFSDPEQAIAAVKSAPPDLFFIDYRLPNTTGEKVAEAIDPLLPKVLVTGEINVQTKIKFERVFSKPFVLHQISAFIAQYSK